jgi:hypothetical protein
MKSSSTSNDRCGGKPFRECQVGVLINSDRTDTHADGSKCKAQV